jgi:hypothetical protein
MRYLKNVKKKKKKGTCFKTKEHSWVLYLGRFKPAPIERFDITCEVTETKKQSSDVLFLLFSYKPADVNFKCTRKCINRLQLMDCKCEVDPTGNCVFENKFMNKLI